MKQCHIFDNWFAPHLDTLLHGIIKPLSYVMNWPEEYAKECFFNDHKFTLLEHDAAVEVVEQQHQGAWFMVDNGHLKWSTTTPQMIHAVTQKCILFSEWLESNEKNVKHTFWILKGRIFVLRHGVIERSIARCDEILAYYVPGKLSILEPG